MTRKLVICYIGSMRHLLFILALLTCLLPVQAKNDVGQLLGGLLQVISEPQPSSAPAQSAKTSLSDQLVLTLRGATDSLLESYKEEGREYAKEVGDTITQRMLENEKLNSTLNSVRYLCWGVIAYLTVVTLLMLLLLLRLRVLYSKLIKSISETKK